MATKKKSSKKSKKTSSALKRLKAKPAKKAAQKRKAAKNSGRKVVQNKSAQSKSVKTKSRAKSVSSPKIARAPQPGKKRPASAFKRDLQGPDSAGQSGDLQGLSNLERADSESVDELIEEGNAFEAGVVAGVEEADDAEVREVHTHEVPEDDVPEEYLDKDE